MGQAYLTAQSTVPSTGSPRRLAGRRAACKKPGYISANPVGDPDALVSCRRLAVFLIAVIAAAAPTPAAAQAKEPWAGFDADIEAAMRTWQVPGLGLA